MRVLMTADAVGGVWEYALELGRGLRRAGVEILLAVMGPPPCDEQRGAAARAGVKLAAAPFRLEWMDDPWEDVAAAGDWLLEQARDCDLVHLNGFAHAVLPFRGPTLVVGHSCVLSWWQAVHGKAAPAGWDPYRRAVAAGLAMADRVVAPTRWMLEALARHHGAERGEVVHNGRSAGDYRPRPKQRFVLSAGRLWDEAKNARQLARVAAALPWPVKIAGALAPGGWVTAGESFGAATLLGALPPERLAGLMGEAAIYVSPARYEPFGLTVLEAALSGCALVLGDIPSLRELWRGAAVFVDPDDDEQLEATLRALMSAPELTASWARRARRRARLYSSRRMVERYLAVYQQMLAPPMVAGASPREVQSSCAS